MRIIQTSLRLLLRLVPWRSKSPQQYEHAAMLYLRTYLPACLPTYLPSYLTTYIPTYLPTYLPT